MSCIDKFCITFFHKKIGEDIFLNEYYESSKPDYLGYFKRFIVYRKANEPSEIPPNWHAWLHHMVNEVPKNETGYPWQEIKEHGSNKLETKIAKVKNVKYNSWQP